MDHAPETIFSTDISPANRRGSSVPSWLQTDESTGSISVSVDANVSPSSRSQYSVSPRGENITAKSTDDKSNHGNFSDDESESDASSNEQDPGHRAKDNITSISRVWAVEGTSMFEDQFEMESTTDSTTSFSGQST